MTRRRWGLVAAIAVVLVAGGALLIWSLSRPSGPATTVKAYVAALERGDGAAASMLTAPAPSDAPAALFDALAGASEWISESTTDTLAVQGVDATATVSFTLSGERHSVDIALSDASGSWLITRTPVAVLQLTSPLGAGAVVGDVVVPFDEVPPAAGAGGSVTVALLPGVYEVGAAPQALLEGTQTVAAVSPGPTELLLDPRLGVAATAAAETALAEHLTTCTAPTSVVPGTCGIRVPWAADLASLTELRFRIDAPPTFALAPNGGGFTATGGTLVATANGIDDQGAAASFTYRDTDWSVRGSVSFTLNELVLEVW